MPNFVPGIQLCGLYYEEAIRPILNVDFPGLRYSAALLGPGSEVLGFDTEMSTDHDWGPRLQLFLEEEDATRLKTALSETLSRQLPRRFRGYPTGTVPNDDGTHRFQAVDVGLIEHAIRLTTVRDFIQEVLAFDIRCEIRPADWLTFSEQNLRTLTAGVIYHDALGLKAVCERFAYYPRDVWLYLLASGWTRIAQEEHLTGRAGFVGDELGSAVIASRLVRDLMRLCFLMERQYATYPKWFGTAFSRLGCAPELGPILRAVQFARTWQEREEPLVAAYETVAAMHNALGITESLPAKTVSFYNRPFQVIHLGSGFADAIVKRIQDPDVLKVVGTGLIGSIDQFSDSTDLTSHHSWRNALRRLYE